MQIEIERAESYRGYDICLVTADPKYYLILKQGEMDYEQIPFKSVHQAKCHIDDIHNGTALSAEEADRVYDESPAIPITGDEMRKIVDMAVGRQSPTQIRLDYDDQTIDVLDKVNQALHEHAIANSQAKCLQLVDDNEEHDGFIILTIEERDSSQSPEHY